MRAGSMLSDLAVPTSASGAPELELSALRMELPTVEDRLLLRLPWRSMVMK